MKFLIRSVLLVTGLAGGAWGAAPQLNQKTLKPAMLKYLAQRGDFCLGKFEWPIMVTEADRQSGSNDALQMPVLERLALVTSSPVGESGARQYELTEEGRKSYLVKRTLTLGPDERVISHPGDFCAAKLTLDKIVSWQPATDVDGRLQTTVHYTYKIASAAAWTQDPEIKKVFPMVAKVVDGAGNLHLMQSFVWSDRNWLAITPGNGTATPSR